MLRHGIAIEGNVGQGVGTSRDETSRAGTSGARPSHTEDPLRSPDPTISRDHTRHAEGSECHVMPHPCTTYRNICNGPSSEFHDDGLLQYVSQTHSSHSLLFLISECSIVS